MIKEFIKYYKPHRSLFILDFTCAFIMSLMNLVFPVFTKKIIDDLLPSGNMKKIMYFGILLLTLYILRAILQFIVDYWGHTLGVRIEYDMRRKLFKHINKLSFSYFDKVKTGQIMSRIVNDLNQISELAHHGPEDLFIALVTFLGSFFIMLTLNIKMTLVIFSMIPIMLTFAIIKNRELKKSFKDLRVKVGEINAQAEDSISGIRVVKAFNNEEYEEAKFDIGNKSFKETKQKSYKVLGQFFSGITFFSNMINLVVLMYGSYLIYNKELTTGDLVGFLLYVSMFLQPIRKITALIENYQRGMAGFGRFIEIMNIDPEIKEKEDAVVIDKLKGNIEFYDVGFGYNNNKSILTGINMSVRSGQTIAIVGPSGAGKTTLLRLIPRFYEVSSGDIKIDSISIKDMKISDLRKNIGVVEQDVFLFSGTIKENILYGKYDATDEEIIEAAKKANAHEFIVALENGYDTYIGQRGVRLSGGQKQRIAITRIFLKNPPILILDEATSALDTQTERIIQKSLYDLSKNRTTLVIAHRLTTIKNADKIIVLTNDGITECGSHEELIDQDGIYSDLYKLQFEDIYEY
ncbi:ABC transporter ATP-binding protein [Tepidibacter hydrothermalis]|uniref:ABC transporter ATP-binding protein n=1 Tax=Tepidibacter hydrothermalis TaxID=3036126 RepID=A0ABY8EAI6_9FIRM|nr:ABC transporter ATP-binding protein [Tepidibacter hydrothermalis]WFD09811.1 ABC transporter ATP-binding protein [Tepidibacter hydrothermalis]